MMASTAAGAASVPSRRAVRKGQGPWYHSRVSIELDATAAAALDRTATAIGSPRGRAAGREDLEPGTRLAHYRIERKLGQGGMGQVWLATDLALDRPVAIKVLPPEVAGDADRRSRLIREARAQARLVHPHVCHIYFIGEEEGRVFFAMEYVDGETLAQRLERGPLPPDQALELARQAALGLRAADAAGFTHRDIKPSNLMIDRHGVLKVMDFGLVSASSGEPRAGGDDDGGAAPLAASAMVGTPLYMAPEQGRGEAVDRRADIYALGATLHHMIAGAPPYAGDTAAELLSRHASGARPRLTVSLAPKTRRRATLADAVIARMMATRVADRYPDYDQLLAALDQASTIRTRPAGMFVRIAAALLDLVAVTLIAMPGAVLFEYIGGDVGPWILVFSLLAYPLCLARWSTTPGGALLDLEYIPHLGRGKVGYLQAALRFLSCYGPFLVGTSLAEWGHAADVDRLVWTGELVGILGVLYMFGEAARVAMRSVDKRTSWDRVAGTRVCYKRHAEAA